MSTVLTFTCVIDTFILRPLLGSRVVRTLQSSFTLLASTLLVLCTVRTTGLVPLCLANGRLTYRPPPFILTPSRHV